jgi:hypothetical protein
MMKKYLFFITVLLTGINLNAQVDFFDVLTGAATSQNGRAPQGARPANRSVLLVTATEMSAAGWTNGDVLSGLGFTYLGAQDIATTGSMTIYLQNTADTANNKSTTWAAAITGMATVNTGNVTIPAAVGEFNIIFNGTTPFTYTGGGLYVAFDYQNFSNPVASLPNTGQCNTLLTGGVKSAMAVVGATTAPTTIAASAFRPTIRLGFIAPNGCARPRNVVYYPITSTANSANLSWETTSNANVEVQYAPEGTAITAGTTVTASGNTFNLTGLTPSTAYQYRVRTVCGAGVFSDWSNVVQFNTTFDAATPPYTTSFEQPRVGLYGWTTNNAAFVLNVGEWQTGNFGPGALVQDQNFSMYALSSTAASNSSVFSRGINLTAGSTVTVSFFASNYIAGGSTGVASYELRVGNAQTVAAQTTLVGSETGFSSAPFVQKSFNFVPPTTGVYYFSLVHTSPANATGTHGLFVDNFNITQVLSSSSFEKLGLKMYPNPANEFIYIQNASSEISQVEIIDLNGRIINNVSKAFDKINVANLTPGIYSIKVYTNEGNATSKFIKE